jgi:ABC-type antimicrobial peptide transport system permease subunit
MVNEHFAAANWPGESPVGKRLRLFEGNDPSPWLTVVGVISNIAQSVGEKPEFAALVYLPYSQNSFDGMNVIVRTKIPPESLGTAIRREISAVESDAEVWNLNSVEDVLRGRYWNNQLYGTLFLLFATVALLVASIGLYAVIAHSVSQRTQEIGVRMALGGTAGDIRALVFKQGLLPAMVGMAAGLVASLGVNRLLQASLVQVSPSDPVTLATVATVLIAAASLGCLIPARRAMRVDPVVALSHD